MIGSIPLHPALVHLPLALSLLIPLIALGVAIGIHRGKLPRSLWAGVLALQVALVGAGFLAMQTGEDDEERVERIVSEDLIEEHEEAAESFVYSAAGVAVLFVLGVALPRPAWRSGAMALSVLASVGIAAVALSVGHSGGELVYVHGAAAAHAQPPASGAGAGAGAERELHDDDD